MHDALRQDAAAIDDILAATLDEATHFLDSLGARTFPVQGYPVLNGPILNSPVPLLFGPRTAPAAAPAINNLQFLKNK
ncbi:hypothetical protein [Lewinella sp. 4G2]|uniref:hypothetical protein n=1 Tax=Lewinella sp. 4G2 TaxID=1803372 RepID=UPI0007B48543|nr:hypothetical protein [Lewinella sp. 4G2]OAV43593.1 hypothetical protein A3850_003370 [Lewinella sp. 4G2]